MTRKSGRTKKIVAGTVAELKSRGSLSFGFKVGDFPMEGFVIRVGKELKAYVNRCPHAGTTLDYGDGDFFTDDKKLLMCRTHGAIFVPKDGSCAGGPCNGQGLTPLEVSESRGKVIVTLAPQAGQ